MIILIDDNTISSFFIKQEIEKSDYISKVVSFDNTLEALSFLRPLTAVLEKPVFIFIKIDMPQLNGYEFIEKCKEMKGNQEYLNIILMTKEELDTEEEIKISKYSHVTSINSYQLNKEHVRDLILSRTTIYLESKAS
ncbi:response regulator [Aquimarina litoralis]|uniref:response regulator n=1 Tax=Aquimarina litoralis TaxID=584605 RepID=UPI001C563D4E|nr:response regulator [Aquimarina litoralis]MBW1293927.1 response regulator [Aquimarina litoralis]